MSLFTLALALSTLGAGPAEPERVELTVILPLTGALALAGQSSQRGLQVLEKHVNATGGIQGRPLAWRFLDDQSNAQVSVHLANETIARGAQVFIGGAGAAQCRATAPIVAKSGPVLYCMSPAARPDPGSFVFSTGVQPHDQIAAALRFFRDNHWNKIALLVTNDASGQEADQNFTDLMKQPENARCSWSPTNTIFRPTSTSARRSPASKQRRRKRWWSGRPETPPRRPSTACTTPHSTCRW